VLLLCAAAVLHYGGEAVLGATEYALIC